MTLRKDLNRYLEPTRKQSRGTVVEIKETSIVVSSNLGKKEFTVSNISAYAVGTLVRFQGDVFLGKVTTSTTGITVTV